MIETRQMGALRLAAGMLAAVALLGGCGGDDDDDGESEQTTGSASAQAGVFVGAIEGTDAYIALISDGRRLTGGYLSDSKELSTWLTTAELSDGGADLVARRGDTVGNTTLTGDSATGEATVAGSSHGYTATLATGKAGLYRTTRGAPDQPGFTETGWIVLPDGSVRARTNIASADGFETESAPSKPEGQVTDFVDPYGF